MFVDITYLTLLRKVRCCLRSWARLFESWQNHGRKSRFCKNLITELWRGSLQRTRFHCQFALATFSKRVTQDNETSKKDYIQTGSSSGLRVRKSDANSKEDYIQTASQGGPQGPTSTQDTRGPAPKAPKRSEIYRSRAPKAPERLKICKFGVRKAPKRIKIWNMERHSLLQPPP